MVALKPSYPEGNFEGNQLLGGSIGLSPLCLTQATQFARQNSGWLPPQFPKASPWNGIVHHLSGPRDLALTQNLVQRASGLVSHAAYTVWVCCLHHALRFPLRTFQQPCASSIDSLIRVSRRAEGGSVGPSLTLLLTPCPVWETGWSHRSHQP